MTRWIKESDDHWMSENWDVMREHDGWYAYDYQGSTAHGPFESAALAKKFCEEKDAIQ